MTLSWRCLVRIALARHAAVLIMIGATLVDVDSAKAGQPNSPAVKEPEITVTAERTLVVFLKVNKAGDTEYELDKVTCRGEAALVGILKKRMEELKKVADCVSVRLVVLEFANLTKDTVKAAEKACRDAGGEVATAPMGRLRKGERAVIDAIHTVWMGTDQGKVKYLLGAQLLEGEAELAAAIKPLVEKSKLGDVYIAIESTDFTNLTDKELAAAKAACVAAGAKVEKLPDLPKIDPTVRSYMRAEGRHADIAVKGVGVRDGILQFRVDDRLVEGEAALARVLQQRIREIEKEKGGFTLITPGWQKVPELEVSPGQEEAVWSAIESATPNTAGFFGFRDGGGRKVILGKRSRGWTFPVVTFVRVTIVAPVEDGNRYLLGERTVDGERALTVALENVFADSHKGQENTEGYFLSIKLAVEAKPGITATEGQIERARVTVNAVRREPPPLQYVRIAMSAAGKYAVDRDAIDGDAALIAKIKDLAAVAGKSGRMLQLIVELAEGAGMAEETAKVLRQVTLDSGTALRLSLDPHKENTE